MGIIRYTDISGGSRERQVSTDGFSETSSCLFAAAKVVSSGVPLAGATVQHVRAYIYIYIRIYRPVYINTVVHKVNLLPRQPGSDEHAFLEEDSFLLVSLLSCAASSRDRDQANSRSLVSRCAGGHGEGKTRHVCKETPWKTPR